MALNCSARAQRPAIGAARLADQCETCVSPIYTGELRLRNKTLKRKVSTKLRKDRHRPKAPNEPCSMDFRSDQLFDGRRIRIRTIVNAYTRVAPAKSVRLRYHGRMSLRRWSG